MPQIDGNGWLKGWKLASLIGATLVSFGLIVGYVARTVSKASVEAVGRIVAEKLAADSTRSGIADIRTLSRINELSIQQAAFKRRLDEQARIVARTNTLVTRGLRAMLQKPTPEQKKRLLASVGVDTSAHPVPHP